MNRNSLAGDDFKGGESMRNAYQLAMVLLTLNSCSCRLDLASSVVFAVNANSSG